MNPLDFIPKTVLAALAISLAVACGYLQFNNFALKAEVAKAHSESAQREARYEAAAATAAKMTASTISHYRTLESELRIALDQQKENSDAQIKSLAAQRDALRLRFAQVQTRTPATGDSAGSPASNFAKVAEPRDLTLLSWQVGLLIDEAYRADEIRVNLLTCYAAYDSAQAALAKPVQSIAHGE